MTRRHKAYLYLLAVAVIWGAAGPVIKFTLQGIPPFPFLAYRFFVSAIIAVIYFLFAGFKLPKSNKLKLYILAYSPLVTTVALGLLFLGLNDSSVLDLVLIGALGPLLIAAGGAFFFHDRITHKEKIGILVVLAGVLINSFLPLLTDGGPLMLTGNIFLILFLLADSSAVLIAKKGIQEKISPLDLVNMAFIVGALTMIPITFLTFGVEPTINAVVNLAPQYHLGVLYMAIISGTLAYILSLRGIKSIEVSEATLFSYLQPVFSVPLAIFWLGETLTLHFVLGAAFIIAGLFIAERKN